MTSFPRSLLAAALPSGSRFWQATNRQNFVSVHSSDLCSQPHYSIHLTKHSKSAELRATSPTITSPLCVPQLRHPQSARQIYFPSNFVMFHVFQNWDIILILTPTDSLQGLGPLIVAVPILFALFNCFTWLMLVSSWQMIRGRICHPNKSDTFNQLWTVEEQVCILHSFILSQIQFK